MDVCRPLGYKFSFHRVLYYRPSFLFKTKICALDKPHHFVVPAKRDAEHTKPESEQTLANSRIRCPASRLRHGASVAILGV